MKHAVDGTTPINDEYFTAAKGSARSLLQKLHATWVALGGRDGRHPDLRLVTDRNIDDTDPIVSKIDRLDNRIADAACGAAKAVREQRERWAEHLKVDEDELIEFLRDLRIDAGRSVASERDLAKILLSTLGYASDDAALAVGVAVVRDWVQAHDRRRTRAELLAALERLPREKPEGALVVIEGMQDEADVAAADRHHRFIDLYELDGRTLMPGGAEQILGDLDDTHRALQGTGHQRVVINGNMRLSLAFAVGHALLDVRGYAVEVSQHDELWSSETATPAEIVADEVEIGSGNEIAVLVSLSADARDDVVAYVSEALPDVGKVIVASPKAGAGNHAVTSEIAEGLAVAIRDAARNAVRSNPDRVHLFLAAPKALAVLLGHRWSSVRPTTVYEHRGIGRGYSRAFEIPE